MSPEPPTPIDAARRTAARPHAERLVPYDGVPQLLAARTAERPGAECLVFHDLDGRRSAWTYAEVAARVAGVAGGLRAAGVGRGDRVATVARNHADTVIRYLAAWTVGATVVPVNAGEDDDRIAWILADAAVRLVWTQPEFAPRLEALRGGLPRLERIVVDDDSPAPAAAGPAAAPPGLDDAALIVYTSGTTGRPKGVVLTQYNLLVDAAQIAAWHGVGRGDRMLCVLPLHHVNGTVVTLLTPLSAGGAIVLEARFRTETFFERLAGERIAVVSVVPTLLAFLLQAVEAGEITPSDFDLSAFRHVICGAGPLTVELALAFEQRFGMPIIHGYGLSETTCYSCFLPVGLREPARRAWLGDHGFPSIGVAIPSNEMAIQDPAGRALPAGERGEIVIRGHNVMSGYYRNDAANAAAFTHGWFRSGDEGFWRPDADGTPYFFITGRLKELIIRGGVNVSPLEIDEVLAGIPGVRAGVAVGFPNDVYGEEIGAFVVPLPGAALDEAAVLAGCAGLPHHKRPKVVVFGDEAPVTSTGKIQRNRLKDRFAAWRGVRFRKPD